MDRHVRFEVALLRKFLIANVALERLIVLMGQLVFREACSAIELQSAQSTLEFLQLVQPLLVVDQSAFVREPSVADLTLHWFFFVVFQIRFLLVDLMGLMGVVDHLFFRWERLPASLCATNPS